MLEAIQNNPLVAAVTLFIGVAAFAGGTGTAWYTVSSLTDTVEDNSQLLADVRRVQEDIRRAQTRIAERLAGIANRQQSFDNLQEDHRLLTSMVHTWSAGVPAACTPAATE